MHLGHCTALLVNEQSGGIGRGEAGVQGQARVRDQGVDGSDLAGDVKGLAPGGLGNKRKAKKKKKKKERDTYSYVCHG